MSTLSLSFSVECVINYAFTHTSVLCVVQQIYALLVFFVHYIKLSVVLICIIFFVKGGFN